MKLIHIIIKSLLGLIYFTFTITIAIILFMDIDNWGDIFYKKLNYKVSQKFLGGDIASIVDNGEYFTRIHKPVFDGILNSSNKGFIQIDLLSNKQLPEYIMEKIDYNNDGVIDFKINLYPFEGKANLNKYNDKIINLLDRTSMGLLNLRGYDDGRYSIFTYNDYEEAKFLGYSFEDLQSIEVIKNLVTPEYRNSFNVFLVQKSNNIIIEMNSKFNDIEKIKLKCEKFEEDGEVQNKIIFEVLNNKKREELIVVSEIDDLYNIEYISPKTIFKTGRSVRVIVKKY